VRKYARWLLNHAEEVQQTHGSLHLRRYGPEVQHALFLVWHTANRICAKRLISFLPTLQFPLIRQAYDLSKREGEILQSVSRGHSTVEIASTFHISSNTVQDHLKAIFEKVGVRSRRELVGQLFAEHYQPHIAAGRNLDTNG
jgi:DNA-binding CsgD family transcriptional regulator